MAAMVVEPKASSWPVALAGSFHTRGAMTLQLAVILVPVLFGLMGFALDLGRLYLVRGEINQAAAAAAIAAAGQLIGTTASLDHADAVATQTIALNKVAEKLEASVRQGEANTRMKDFFDLWFLSRKFPFDGELLKDAITRTFARREMPLPATVPVALTHRKRAL